MFTRVIVIVCLLIIGVQLACNQLPEPKAQAPTDLHGDTLPEGSIARLGTQRFRHEGWVTSVAYSPDGVVLASGGYGTIRLWDAKSGKELRQIEERYFAPHNLAFSPDGKIIASTNGSHLFLWDSKSGEKLFELASGRHFSISPDGMLLAARVTSEQGGKGRSQLRLWEVATGKESRTFDVDNEVTAFSPEGKVLLAGGGYTGNGPAKPLVLLAADTGKRLATLAPPEEGGATCAVFSPDGKLLIAANCLVNRKGESPWKNPSAILVWEVPSGKLLRRLGVGVTGGNDSLAVSPDGKVLAQGRWVAGEPGRNNLISLWDLATGQELRKLPGNECGQSSVAFSPDGQTLASAGRDSTVRRWNVRTGEEILTASGHESDVTVIAFAPDGETLVSGGADRTMRLWDVGTGQERFKLLGHRPAAFSPDGKTLAATVFHDPAIVLLDPATGKQLGRLEAAAHSPSAMIFAPDGKTLAAAGADRSVRIWDLVTRKELHKMTGHRDPIACVAFSADGKTLASGGGGSNDVGQPEDANTIRLWDAATGKELRKFGARQHGPVFSVAFSADGKFLASGGGNAWERNAPTVFLWDAANGQEIRRIAGVIEQDHVRSMAFSPDSKILAAAHADQTIRFWEPGTGKELHAIRQAHRGAIRSVAFSADGKRLASCSEDTTILIWDASSIHK